MYYKDDFNVTFEEESAFYKYLDDVEKRAEFPSHKNHDIRLSNAKNDVKLDYFKRGNFPGAEAGKIKCDGDRD